MAYQSRQPIAQGIDLPTRKQLRGIDGPYRVGIYLVGMQYKTRSHRILWIALGGNDAITRVAPLAQVRPQ